MTGVDHVAAQQRDPRMQGRVTLRGEQFHDVVGYYNRFDVFDLTVTRERPRPATWVDRDPGTPVMLSDDPAA